MTRLLLILLVCSTSAWSQIALPIQQSVLPKNSLVVNYDFSKSASYTRGSTTVSNISASGNANLLGTPNFMNSLGFISFNETSQYLMTPNLRPLFRSVNASVQKSFTMSLWFFPKASNGVIVSEHESQTINSGLFNSNIELVNGVIKYRVWDGTAINSSSITLNQWYHIAMVYDGATVKAYLNGILQGTQIYDRVIRGAAQNYSVGAPSNTNMGSGLHGNFDLAQFKLHHLPLTDSDILQEYNLRKDEFDYTIHSPITNVNPTYWNVSSAWHPSNDQNNPSGTFDTYAYVPWLNSSLGWVAQQNSTSQFISLSYDEPVLIKGIVTQGRKSDYIQWVSQAHIETSMTGGEPWTRVLPSKSLNVNMTDDVYTPFTTPVFAKAVRVIPTSWNLHITMRMGMLVKPNNPVTDGLVLNLDAANIKSYPGTGTVWNDVNSTSYPFTLTLGPVFNSNGFFDLDGDNDYAVRVHTPALKPTTAITLEQWLNADDWKAGTSSSNYKCSLSCTSGGGYSHNIWSGIFTSYIYAGGGYRTPSANVSSLVGWHHFVTTFDGRYTRLYVDGELKSTIDIGTSGNLISYIANSIFVGAEASGGTAPEGFYWDGKIGTTAIYNRSLSESEIITNYNASKYRYTLFEFKSVGTTAWKVPSGVTSVDYLVVAGGGGGANGYDNAGGGGGGAGMVLSGSLPLISGSTLNITVGDGGGGGANSRANNAGSSGNNSSFHTITALAGGGGFGSRTTAPAGASQSGSSSAPVGGGGSDGGNGGKGGGGSIGNGSSNSGTIGGAGGAGFTSDISGSSLVYGTGGAGANSGTQNVGINGINNTGNGGRAGGATSSSSAAGGKGGTGVVILKLNYN